METIQEEIDLGFYRPVLIETKLLNRQSNNITRVCFLSKFTLLLFNVQDLKQIIEVFNA